MMRPPDARKPSALAIGAALSVTSPHATAYCLATKTLKTKIPLDSLESILKVLTKRFGIFTLYTKEDGVCWLGRLNSIDDKTLVIDDLSSKGKWEGQRTFKTKNIRVIEFDTDYINSLKLVSKRGLTKKGSR